MSQGANVNLDADYLSQEPAIDDASPVNDNHHVNTIRTIGFLKLRGKSDNLPQKWWFASTPIPLIAATIGPLCNVLSIAALVTPWRVTLANNGQLPEGTDDSGVGITDPKWEIVLNAISLVCGFAGNFFLMLNFTGRVRYIIALPLSIIFWVLSSTLLIGITSAMHVYVPPIGPGQIYSQGFWHAVHAAILYFLGAFILAINLTGYLKGHFPQQFDLDNDQRTLILQTMGFFFWLAGGAGIFCAIENFTFTNALYYADVSVLTIGFGDLYPSTDAGRGFLFVFELLGVIQLGLVISSISRFVSNISADKIIKTHQKHARESTVGRTVTSEKELRERLGLPPRTSPGVSDTKAHRSSAVSPYSEGEARRRSSISKYGRLEIVGRTVTFHENNPHLSAGGRGAGRTSSFVKKALSRDEKMRQKDGGSRKERWHQRRQKLLLLQEEKDRFEAMREIQDETRRFKQYYALALSLLAFGVLWCFGALVFMVTEKRILGMSYFQSLYFCFISLFTIGYGDMSPQSNIGKPFFIVWSIFAVPTMTVLIQEMSNTVIAAVNNWTLTLADFTVLPRKGVFRMALDKNPALKEWVTGLIQRKQEERRVREGFQLQNPDDISLQRLPLDGLAEITEEGASAGGGYGGDEEEEEGEEESAAVPDLKKPDSDGPTTMIVAPTEEDGEDDGGAEGTNDAEDHELARQVAQAIKRVAQDLRAQPPKCYSFEQWVYFMKLIRFSRWDQGQDPETVKEEGEEGLMEWDWLGEDSPMLADITEAEWLLDRLCESLTRYTKRQARLSHKRNRHGSMDIIRNNDKVE